MSSEISHLVVALVSFGVGVFVTGYHFGPRKLKNDLGFRKDG